MTTTDDTRRRPWLTPRARKWVLVLHVVSAVGWLGINFADFVLAVTGMTTTDPATQHAMLHALAVVGGTLLIPISLLALVSGLTLALGTQWGLLRYKWVIVKLVLTVIAIILLPVALLPELNALRDLATETPAGQLVDTADHSWSILSAAVVSTSMYITNVIMSVLKPFGRTRRGNRARPKIATA
jgi:hypothetical protein